MSVQKGIFELTHVVALGLLVWLNLKYASELGTNPSRCWEEDYGDIREPV